MALNIEDLLKQLQDQYTAANTAGLERYQNLMRGVNDAGSRIAATYNDAFANLKGLGESAKSDIRQQTIRNKAASSQDLMSRGLGNTTITATNNRGIEDDAARQEQAVNENLAQQRSNLDISRAGSQMGVANLWSNALLSRQDQGPDASLYANLIQSLAANGGGNGGGGFGGGGGGRSYNFVGGVPHGGNSAINMGSVGGGGGGGSGGGSGVYEGPGNVATFRNPGAGGLITQAPGPAVGSRQWNDMHMVPGSDAWMAEQMRRRQAQA